MKKRMISALCAGLLVMNLSGAVMALEPRASDYFSYTDAYATALDDGEVLIEFDIDATHTMQEVGATEVYIYERQSNGTYENVYTFYSDDHYSSMIDTNSAFGNGEVTYQGTVGKKYYALVALYARDSEGAEWMSSTTNIVTAVANAS